MMSVTATPGLQGSPSGPSGPVVCMSPYIALTIKSKPGRLQKGPVGPNPVMEQ